MPSIPKYRTPTMRPHYVIEKPHARPSRPMADPKRSLLTVILLSPQNEAHLMKALEHYIRRAWPESRGLLTAACNQKSWLCRADKRTRAGVRAVRDRSLWRPKLTPLDRLKVSESRAMRSCATSRPNLRRRPGSAMIRLTGHGGSGKTTVTI